MLSDGHSLVLIISAAEVFCCQEDPDSEFCFVYAVWAELEAATILC